MYKLFFNFFLVGLVQTQNNITFVNNTDSDLIVNFVFGSGSVFTEKDISFCQIRKESTCKFLVKYKGIQVIPALKKYLNATVSFGTSTGCGSTKIELNLNNPQWKDIVDISLVDGFNKSVSVEVIDKDMGSFKLGPVYEKKGNEKAFGVFPFGCDVCTSRISPPCGIKPGKTGCKEGLPYSPEIPCQYQGYALGGGSEINIVVW